jgi:hypothetical protein
MGMGDIWLNGTFKVKYPSSEHPSDEDACAVWLHRSAILGSAALGEAADAMVGLCFVCIYRTLTREYLSHLIFILIPLWRGFYFSEDMLSVVHTVDVSYRRTRPWWGGRGRTIVCRGRLGRNNKSKFQQRP